MLAKKKKKRRSSMGQQEIQQSMERNQQPRDNAAPKQQSAAPEFPIGDWSEPEPVKTPELKKKKVCVFYCYWL